MAGFFSNSEARTASVGIIFYSRFRIQPPFSRARYTRAD